MRVSQKTIKGENYDPETGKKETITVVFPSFIALDSQDLMIRGKTFYAIWDDDVQLWSTSEERAIAIIDKCLDEYVKEKQIQGKVRKRYLWDTDSGMIDKWHKYCERQMWDHYASLDSHLTFSNHETHREDYASKKLPYPLVEGSTDAFDSLFGTLYSEEELHKIMWAIGSIVEGDSSSIQKFLVLYGSAGTGKSSILKVIEKLFKGYCGTFDARALGSVSQIFALEAFRDNPLVAIQHDGDLSHIEDNTRLNSLVSHETMIMNVKHKSGYAAKINAFLFMGTNKPVKITDAKSGLLRRLIDVSPTGKKVAFEDYTRLMKQIEYELSGIAYKCWIFYKNNKNLYDEYVPLSMMSASNDFYNYIIENLYIFNKDNPEGITLKWAWTAYKQYCDEARVPYPMTQRVFKEELKNYFENFDERLKVNGEVRINVYRNFRIDKVGGQVQKRVNIKNSMLDFKKCKSAFDIIAAGYLAQYATSEGTPSYKWVNVSTKLQDIKTSLLHYVKVPMNHIVIDFDLKDDDGNKSLEKNIEAASQWPDTYAELSKSGCGIHLHYIYDGDPDELASLYAPNIEIKVFKGDASLRRQLTLNNGLPINHISSGLPLKEKGAKKMIDKDIVHTEKSLKKVIAGCLNKEYDPPSTKCMMELMKTVLEDAVAKGVVYDISDMSTAIRNFAQGSSHNARYCMDIAMKLPYKNGVDETEPGTESEGPLAFFDIEVFPNLLFVCYKVEGEDEYHDLFNPTPDELEFMFRYRLVGYNCRKYDNHIIVGRYLGDSIPGCYDRSRRIIVKKDQSAFLKSGWNLSYTDIFDFASIKQSLKKWEIEMGSIHDELGFEWDKPLPEEFWARMAQYCHHDVDATEKLFYYKNKEKKYDLPGDFLARLILAKLAGLTPNATTNQCTTKFIFGDDKDPQKYFNYRDLSKPVRPSEEVFANYGKGPYRVFDADGEPVFRDYIPGEELPEGWSIMPFFPGYKFNNGVSTYMGVEVGEGGRVYAEPGLYEWVDLLDIASMHPHSMLAEKIFGLEYTKKLGEIVQARIYIKHKEFDKARQLLDGALAEFLEDEEQAKGLAQALKIAINSIYGLTDAGFDNKFRDNRNIDNIVAKRGALFMCKLAKRVQELGYTVAHIKTDSIKIPNSNETIRKFVMDYGKEFGYTFEHEDTYEKLCLVNNAVYVAKAADGHWTATGKEFQIPYVFKTLFSKEPMTKADYIEVFSVQTALYLDNNESLTPALAAEKELDGAITKYKKYLISDEDMKALYTTLKPQIDAGHDYHFIGKVGAFLPVRSGLGGCELMRQNTPIHIPTNFDIPRWGYATGSSGYRWLEASDANEADIDISYYEALKQTAWDDLQTYTNGHAEEFCA